MRYLAYRVNRPVPQLKTKPLKQPALYPVYIPQEKHPARDTDRRTNNADSRRKTQKQNNHVAARCPYALEDADVFGLVTDNHIEDHINNKHRSQPHKPEHHHQHRLFLLHPRDTFSSVLLPALHAHLRKQLRVIFPFMLIAELHPHLANLPASLFDVCPLLEPDMNPRRSFGRFSHTAKQLRFIKRQIYNRTIDSRQSALRTIAEIKRLGVRHIRPRLGQHPLAVSGKQVTDNAVAAGFGS